MQGFCLGYYDIRGRAQPIRFLLEYVGAAYEDKQYADPTIWFQQDKLLYKDNPLVNLPYLKDGDKVIFESLAIPVYICHRTNHKELLGSNIDEQVFIQQTIGILGDILSSLFSNVIFAPQQVFGTDGKQAFNDKVFPLLKKLDSFLQGRKFIAGNNVTWPDFNTFEIEDLVKNFDDASFQKLPNLKLHWTNISNLQKIKAYIQKSPKIPFYHSGPGKANWG